MPLIKFQFNPTVWEEMSFDEFQEAAVAAILDMGTERF